MRNPNDTNWLKFALSVRNPFQFVAWAFALSVAVMLAAISNTTLDKAGLIWVLGIVASVQFGVLLLGALIVSRQSDRS